MFSGKTQYVIRYARRFKAIGKKVVFVNHILDDRYALEHVVSHDGMKEKCISVSSLFEVVNNEEYKTADIVILEESQFFTDLYDFVEHGLRTTDKEFIVSGLSGDFNRKPIGQILSIIPLAEHVDKLNGLCCICADGTIGAFTKRITDEKDQISVGSTDKYQCVCRQHFY